MRFNPAVIADKIQYLDTTPQDYVQQVARKYLGEHVEIRNFQRCWSPGGGGQCFIARSETNACFIKAKHKSLLVESALESEKEFSSIVSLENEYAFLCELQFSPHVPKPLGLERVGNYLLLVTEAVQPFALEEFSNPKDLVDIFNELKLFIKILYDRNIVHTDIHEKNICLRGKCPVLVDFEEARHMDQHGVPFERSLDVAGRCGINVVGMFPAQENESVAGLTCLERLRTVFRKRILALLPEYLTHCNFDCSSDFNLDTEQTPDERIYQSVSVPGLTIPGQRPVEDPRFGAVRRVLEYARNALGRHIDVVDLGANLGMVSAFCAGSGFARSVTGLEADVRYVEAAEVLAFCANTPIPVRFEEYRTGTRPYAWSADVLLMLSVYHHIPDKDAFLRELAARNIVCILGEFATQARYYPERGSVEREIEHIRRALGFARAEQIGLSPDYRRPLVVFHNAAAGLSHVCSSPQTAVATEPDSLPPDLPRRRRDAIAWLRRQSAQGGVNVSDRERVPYPEVTGYFVPTLLQWGETDLALQYARWLLTMQRADGAFLGPGMELPFAFDTGQIIRGLAAAVPRLPEAAPALERACEWLIGASSPEGRLPLPENMAAWQLEEGRGHVNEAIHLYVLPGLLQAAEALDIPRYAAFARRSLDYYIRHCNLTNFYAPNMLLHFYCYIQEALFDMGAEDVCRAGMRLLEDLQGEDGRVPAYADVDWVCTPGQIQAALVWFKLGDTAHGLPALRLGTSLQRPSGGFPGSVGPGATYFPDAEISWPVKFWLDALRAREEQQGHADVHPRPVELVAPRVPEEGELPLIALAQGAAECLAAVSLSPDTDGQDDLLRTAAAVPVLLEWGRREAALKQAGALAARSGRFLAESEGAEDFLFTLAALIRAFRQPETLGLLGDGLLKRLCLPVFHRQRLAAADNPGLFAAFAELAQAGETLHESAWTDCAHAWARRQRNLPDQRPSVRLVGDAVGVGLLLAPANGLALLRRVIANAGLPLEGGAKQAMYERLALTLARGAWRLGDDALGSEAFRCGLAARVAAQNLPWQAESAEAFLAAFSAMQRCRFTQQFPHFLDSIDASDGRLAFVKAHLPTAPEAKILDMGTARGRYVRRLLEAGFPGQLTGQDVHDVFAAHMPPGVATGVGTVLRSGWRDAAWDAVMLCEVLEHCVDLPAALQELRRILRPGGTLVIIDKNLDRLAHWPGGIPPWEQWFDADKLAAMLRDTGFAVTALERRVPYEGRNDGLFFGLSASRD